MVRIAGVVVILFSCSVMGGELSDAVRKDYDEHLFALFDHFHRNPELSTVEHETARRMALELNLAGYDVTEGVGGTGVVAMLENGAGPTVMMRADMDGLPIQEKSGLPNASVATQKSPISGKIEYTKHACGHDTHITSLVGTARYMAAHKDLWSGTLMLIVQPAEEAGGGSKAMREDGVWERFGKPDYALAFHASPLDVAGKINVTEGSPFAGADSVDIVIHGVGAHGAYPHEGKDPIVLGSQIVLALQTLVAREISPREPGVVTVGSFHSGTKHNIIPDQAVLQLTVRSTSAETRQALLDGIRRIAENMARAAGIPEDKLPEVTVLNDAVPPTINDPALARQLRRAWIAALGENRVVDNPTRGMGAEDFPFFTVDPDITSVYWRIGGTPQADFDRAASGGEPVPSQHSPLFRIDPEETISAGVESTVVALIELMRAQ